ncbi:MAG: MerR family transcriptional regulator [Acidimicrobiia bacterium]|nr:MerR family transcriptional regulator [Acidimicrobiia bacterium]
MQGDVQPELLTIGEVARRAGLAPSALRFYEAEGLVEPAERVSGRRRYEPRVLRRLDVIDLAKRAGFSLAEVRELLDGFEAGVPASQRWQALAERKLPEVQGLIDQARAMKRLLGTGLTCACLRLDRNLLFAGSDRCRARPSPFASARGPGLVQAGLLFDTLLWKDASGRFLPWLAEGWESSPDKTQWHIRLRPGVRWHDGSALTAHDVEFTFEYLMSGPGSHRELIQHQGLERIVAVQATGPNTVVFGLEAPYPPFEEWVAGRVLILPKHVWSRVDDPFAAEGPETTMGSGPYLLESYHDTTGACTYDANDDYFLGLPYVRRLEFLALPDPLAAFHRGEVDAVNAGGEEAGFNASFGAVRHRTFATMAARGEWARALYFNLAKGFPFDDLRFRHAVAYGIDRDELVRRVLFGRGEAGSAGGLGPSHPLAAPDLVSYRHDPAQATALLDDLGLHAGTGRRRRGPRLTVGLQTSSASADAAELIAGQLGEVGIEVGVEVLSLDDADTAAAEGRYELALVGYGSLGGDPDWLRLQLCSTIEARSRIRVHGYQSRRFDDLAVRQLSAPDGATRQDLVYEMQRVVAEDIPMLCLYVPTRVIAFDEQVFDAWYFTPGGVWGAYPGALNKHALVTGKKIGF